VEILLRSGANINEKNVRNISVGETDGFERKRERAKKEREERRDKRNILVRETDCEKERKGAERGQ
jgi:hypothetical protein